MSHESSHGLLHTHTCQTTYGETGLPGLRLNRIQTYSLCQLHCKSYVTLGGGGVMTAGPGCRYFKSKNLIYLNNPTKSAAEPVLKKKKKT